MRGKRTYHSGTNDPWVPRISIAMNNDPTKTFKPVMRAKGDGTPLGGFYVPEGYHLRIHLANKATGGGWFQGRGSSKAMVGTGNSLWLTRADAYSYPDRDPLLLLELNVNDFNQGDPRSWEKGTIWFDVSAVDGINANMQLLYGDKINRRITTPLFQTETTQRNHAKSSKHISAAKARKIREKLLKAAEKARKRAQARLRAAAKRLAREKAREAKVGELAREISEVVTKALAKELAQAVQKAREEERAKFYLDRKKACSICKRLG